MEKSVGGRPTILKPSSQAATKKRTPNYILYTLTLKGFSKYYVPSIYTYTVTKFKRIPKLKLDGQETVHILMEVTDKLIMSKIY